MRGREGKRERRGRGRRRTPVCLFTFSMSVPFGAKPSTKQARSSGSSLDTPCEVHHLLVPVVFFGGVIESGVVLGLQPRPSDMGSLYSKGQSEGLKACAQKVAAF